MVRDWKPPLAVYRNRAGRTRTRDKGIMLPTTAFTASFEFVVWTVSSLYEFAVQSLHLSTLKVDLARD